MDVYTMIPNERDPKTPEAAVSKATVIGADQLKEFSNILNKYKSGKAMLERRIIASENWWKLRNGLEEQKTSEVQRKGFECASGWLHNVLVSKHADAMDAYPEPNILPREQGDKAEAAILSKIIPCILEQNQFERTYSDAMWQKGKTGTGCYKIIWDASKLNGLGDITIERANLLNLFWEPGVTDIQKSRYFFHAELQDTDLLEQQYPQLRNKVKSNTFQPSKFRYDDNVSTDGKTTVIEVYYHKLKQDGAKVLHYCKYVGDTVLYATENDPNLAETGLYEHGKFPFVFDPLFPIEGSPCGYGYVDLCRNPQTEIDLMKTAILKNTMVGATPRFFVRQDGGINREQLLDLSNAVIDVNGNLGQDSIRPVDYAPLSGNYVEYMSHTIQQLRETSGNTETSTGTSGSGVTAASAIAALQEASGKGSRDATQAAYRAYSEIVSLCIELIRQFYDIPRKFRILGRMGTEQFVSYSNQGLQPQHQGMEFGIDMGMRTPVFDIKVSAQRRTVYSKMAQNELALQFFGAGFFNPQISDQALACVDMMEFDGKDELMQKISHNGTMAELLQMISAYAVNLAMEHGDGEALMQLQQMIGQMSGRPMATPAQGGAERAQMLETDDTGGLKPEEHSVVKKARARSNAASQPGGKA